MVRWAKSKHIEANTLQLDGEDNQFLRMYLGPGGELYVIDTDGVEYEVQLKKVKPPKK